MKAHVKKCCGILKTLNTHNTPAERAEEDERAGRERIITYLKLEFKKSVQSKSQRKKCIPMIHQWAGAAH